MGAFDNTVLSIIMPLRLAVNAVSKQILLVSAGEFWHYDGDIAQ